jgi:DNA-binding transcriptional regulator PaaX
MDQSNWNVLVTSVAGQNGSLRVRLWRQMKALGAAALRDGVYLLPARPECARHWPTCEKNCSRRMEWLTSCPWLRKILQSG